MSVFEGFTAEETAKVKAAGTKVRIPEGWSPIWESTPADKAYIVLSGEVSVRHQGREIARLGEGEIIGEAAILNHSLRTASIVAATPLELLHFTSDKLEQLVAEVPAFKKALEDTAATRAAAAAQAGQAEQSDEGSA
ncbi:cyclic nucleotide-binding domain-containing protein [Nocardioides perillae]|uniref:CRP-like cAMP-binding protein n=1 Tax=Nocardioides perillae TaxID=1119534 RepID=A0A7Y9RTC3_9ACTN|nr:CRP-like cAMP-binding protein [Nocardioides perillae]